MIEIELAWGGFLQEFAAAVAEEFVEPDLDFEGVVGVRFVQLLLGVFDEGDFLVGGFGAEHVAEGDVFEAEVLADVVVVGDVDSGGDAGWVSERVRWSDVPLLTHCRRTSGPRGM